MNGAHGHFLRLRERYIEAQKKAKTDERATCPPFVSCL
uniref:Uncharacterized protein n=1 Tax=mine drainage metagenome TaxID=410659 RepID=E6PWX9_9ZZZZ